MSHLLNSGSLTANRGGGGTLLKTGVGMYYRPGDIVVAGTDYDIVAEQDSKGKVRFAVRYR
jgi:hypothetical protein